jgi:NAD(P)-dependent dehydrogenase (short-subunit alcohol dehydrogenase family)
MLVSCAALVTGAAFGLGLELTKFLILQGCSVVMAEIDPAGESVSNLLGSNDLWINTDTSPWEQRLQLFAKDKVHRCFLRQS